MEKTPVIFSYAFNSDGSAKKIDSKHAAEEIENEGLAWVHLNVASGLARQWLEQEAAYLDHLIIDALVALETRPRIMEFENGVLVILRAVNLNKNAEPEDMVSLRIWLDRDRIITIQRREVRAVYEIAERLNHGKAIKSAGEFLYNLIDQILSNTAPLLYSLNEKIDELEDKIITTRDAKFREQMLDIRTQSAVFKRYLSPQRDVISKLRGTEYAWIDDWAKRHFQENLDQITHLVEEAEEAGSRSQILHDEIANAINEGLNKSIYKLSIISIIFMPLTFITGLFGMNVGGIPGSQNPQAFFLCSVVMMIVIAAYLLLLKVKKRV